jgi:hypothetical protein
MVVDWLAFPLVLLAVCLGCGLAVERAGGWTLPGTLLPSLGLALLIVVATLTTQSATIAPLTTWAVVLLALAGYASSWRRLVALRPEPWAAAVGVGVFLVCAAPVVLSGNATFLGYFVDNDSAYHFSLIDQLLAHGSNYAALPLSAYKEILLQYIGTSYPTGADVALGAVRPLVGQDVAWVFQPYLAVILALGGVAIYELLRQSVRSPSMRAVCAFIAAQPGLVYSFYLEDSIKELATTWVITVTVVLVFATLRRLGLRGLVPLLIMAVAGLDVLDLAIVPWIGVPLAVFAIVAIWRVRNDVRTMPRRRLVLGAAAGAALAAALAAPIISKLSTFLTVATGVLGEGTSNGSAQLGNLAGSLQNWQIFGIWPAGDFRYPLVTHIGLAYAVIGIAIAGAAIGAIWMIRRRALAPLLLLISGAVASAYLLHRGSPYADSKVMMIVSVTAVLTAMLGAAALHDSGRRIEGWLLAVVIGGGVLWTNALSYSNVSVAPRARLSELAAIGSRFSGIGPTFYNQSDEFAIHFLRDEAVVDPATGPIPPRPGLPARTPAQGRLPWDPDDVNFSYLQTFRLLVLGRSPRISRPPSDFKLVYRGRYYDVWKRTSTPTVLEHIPLGSGLYPEAVPSCHVVMATAARAAREHARLAYVERTPPPTFVPTKGSYPPDWGLLSGDPYELAPRDEPGRATGTVNVPSAGRYQVWLESALSQRFPVYIGHHYVGSVAYQLGPQGQFVRVGQVTLSAGKQPVTIIRPSDNLAPGQDSTGMLLGPLMLVAGSDPPPVSQIDPSGARALCGRSLDWLEIVR